MKRLLMLTILAMISLTTQLQAQKIDENIKLENEVFTKKYAFMVTDNDRLKIRIKATLNDGSLLLNIYNPAGELQNELDLDASIGQSHSSSEISSNVDNPAIGEWVVELESKRGQGEIKIEVK